MSLAHAALSIVLCEHAGHLASFESDEKFAYRIFRRAWKVLLAADKVLASEYDYSGYRDPEIAPVDHISVRVTAIADIRRIAPDLIADLVDYDAVSDRLLDVRRAFSEARVRANVLAWMTSDDYVVGAFPPVGWRPS